jgi:hypothetical protein
MTKNDDPAKLMRMVGLPPQHYAAIGKVAANWSALELIVDSACWELAGVGDEPGVCLTSQVAGIQRKLDALTALLRLREKPEVLIKDINKFSDRARALAERRNRVVHDPWQHGGSLGTPHRVEASARKKLVFKSVPMPTDEVVALVDEIWNLTDRFTVLMVRAGLGQPSD